MPDQNIERLHELGSFLVRGGRLLEAEAVYRELIWIAPGDPRIQMAFAVVLLSLGKYAEAWPFYEARFRVPGVRPKPNLEWPEWRGEPLAGKKLLVFPEQGLGDQIMFARFAIEQRRAGADVTVLCNGSLVRLFQRAGLHALAAEGAVEFPEPDYWVMSNSLAAASGVNFSQISGVPYLNWPERIIADRIGVVVKGNPHHHNDANRSLPLSAAERLLSMPGAVSLAPEDTGARDFADTAEIIQGLSSVVTVDTSVAHLAGALGKEVFVLLPSILTDWRWGLGSHETPWYRSMRLFRQSGGDWNSAIDRIFVKLDLSNVEA